MKNISKKGATEPLTRSAFRSSWTQPEGAVGSHIMEGKIIDVNVNNWTVDFVSQFDQKIFLNVQVGSPYMHTSNGEGIYAFPEVGAKCHLCIPSDGPPPFILSFIMSMETKDNTSGDKDNGTATFAGGRSRAKPGDIMMKGRDGNFCILHRGGVLQVGSTELAQRIYIPLGNLVTDISQNYHHHNTGGSIGWTVDSSVDSGTSPTVWKQTFRCGAGEEKASVRVSVGTIKDLVGVPISEIGGKEIITSEIGTDDPIIYEVVIAPQGFEADSGVADSNTKKLAVIQYAFDKAGGAYLWARGNVVLATKNKLTIRTENDIDITTKTTFSARADKLARIDGGKLLELQGDVVKIGPANSPVAYVGSTVELVIPAPVPITTTAGPGTLLLPVKLTGLVTQGRDTVLV